MSLIIPKPLKKGDTIGFISPSSGPHKLAAHRIENAVVMLNKLGYKVKIGKHALNSSGYVSDTIENRASDIHDMFRDPEVTMIMCTIGGNNSNQLIKQLDYGLIKDNPKIFMGYSDITVLHYALQSQSNLATYYGPCAMTQFAEFPQILEYTLTYFKKEIAEEALESSYAVPASDTWTEEFLNWFEKEDMKRPRRLEKNEGYEWLNEGVAEGPLLGGAILSINHLAGTSCWLDPKGTIFFLDLLKEEGALNESAVDSFLTDLDNMGVFTSSAGVIISRPTGYSEDEIKRLKVVLKRYVKEKCPMLFNVNIGHSDPIATLRYGRVARLDSFKNEFVIL